MVLSAACVAVGFAGVAYAAPYASNVKITGTTVNFILNEDAAALTYSINGGPAQPLTPTKGAQTFNLGAPTDTFTINASRQDAATGYNVATGGTITAVPLGLSQDTAAGASRQTSDDNNVLTHYNSPRGIDIGKNPNAASFGKAYISNSAAGAPTGRTLGDGMYVVNADQTDAYAYGDNAQQTGVWASAATANSAFRVTVSPSGEVFATGFGDALSGVWSMPSDLSSITQILDGTTGPTALPPGQNHGSVTAAYIEGSIAGGNLKLYTLDEDLTDAQFGGPAGDSRDSLWRYDINGGVTPSTVTPVRINTALPLIPLATSDFDRGADGKFYLNQTRSAGAESGIVVLDPAGGTTFLSLGASRALLNNPTAPDIFRNIQGVAVTTDQKFLTALINDSDFVVIPLLNGMPDIANRLIVDGGADINTGRDIAVDAAGNVHYVSSGQQLYKVFAAGGAQASKLTWNGTSFSFASSTGTLYWDTNGAAAGGGGATPTGNWDGVANNFNVDSTGGSTLGFVTNASSLGDEVVFAAGADGSGTYTVNVSGTQNARTVTVPRGNVTLAGGTINAGSFTVASSATVTSTLTGGAAGNLTKAGSGTLSLAGANTYTGVTTVMAGTLSFKTNHTTGKGVVVYDGATAKIDPSLATPNNVVVKTPFVNTRTSGRFDVSNNKLIVTTPDSTGTYTGTAYTGVTGQIAAGRNGGGWAGSGIVTSQTQAIAGNFTTLGVATAAQVKGIAATDTSVWAGQTVTGSDTLVMYTYGGDANLDGKINVDDYTRIDFNVPLGTQGWYNGDFNYDGKINVDDYTIIDFNVGIQGAPFPTAAGAGLSAVAVPEPASLSLIGLAAASLLGRRRRRGC